MIERFIEQFSKELELETSLSPKETGVYILPLAQGIEIVISTSPLGYQFHSTFGKAPKQKHEEAYEQLLFANLFGKATYRAVLGINATGDQLTLNRVLSLQSDYRNFRDELEDFVNAVDFWSEEVLNYS